MSSIVVIPDPIRSLLLSWGKTPVGIFDVTGRASVAEKRAYRVSFEDGSKAKARVLMGGDHAARWCELRRSVGGRMFLSSMLWSEGNAVLEEWIEGDVLPRTAPQDHLLEEPAGVLARMHQIEVPGRGVVDASAEVRTYGPLLSSLALASAISTEAELQLAAKLSRLAPARMHVGLAHHDFCGENLVLQSSRGVVSIDHEWMRVGSLDFDVARAIRQWSLPDAGSDVFLRRYAAAGGPVDIANLDFWLLANDIFASEVRVRRGWPDAPATVKRLMSWIDR
jgi:thiamine kinase-like enzyme